MYKGGERVFNAMDSTKDLFFVYSGTILHTRSDNLELLHLLLIVLLVSCD